MILVFTKPGKDTNELTLLPKLFQNYSNALFWKIDFSVDNSFSTGQASLILKRNLLPINGTCSCDKKNGTSLSTWFNLNCQKWVDPDGLITKYEFYCKLKI